VSVALPAQGLGPIARRGAAVPPRFRAPEVSPSMVRREHLLRSFASDPAPVTLVGAPAGSGKTSLLARWAADAAAEGATVAWLRVDPRDDDPGRFWNGIIHALRATGRSSHQARLHRLVAPLDHDDPGFVELVLAELAALGGPVWLVLDDVGVLRDEATLRSIGMLARHLPAGVHLVLAGRTDPPIGLARLRVEGVLRELRTGDLAFTSGETATLLRRHLPELSDEVVRAVHDRTEGWAAGVVIAGLALAGTDDPLAVVEGFSGDDHTVAEYLVTEVLAGLTPEVRRFLLRTSVCARMSVGLAQQLTGRSDAAAVLDGLVRDNAFTARLGRDRGDYRYNELFRSFLLGELRRAEPATERELHGVAATWWATQGRPLHAIEHLALAGDLDRLAELATQEVVGALLDGQAQQVSSTLDALDDRARATPAVALVAAAAALERGRLDEADRWLARLGPIPDEDVKVTVLAAAVTLARARYTGRLAAALAALEATSVGGTGDPDLDLYAHYQRGVARGYLGRYGPAVDDLERATSLARATGRDGMLMACLSSLGGAHASAGRLREMRRCGEAALAVAGRHGWTRSSAIAHAHLLVGAAAFLGGDRLAAAGAVALATASMDGRVEPDVELAIRSLDLAVTAEAGGGYDVLRDYRESFARLTEAPVPAAIVAFVAPLLVRTCLHLGERGLALEFVGLASPLLADEAEPALLRAMLLHDTGRLDAALRELTPILDGRARGHVVTTAVRAALLATELETQRGNDIRAHELLCEALAAAEPDAMVQPFLELSGVQQRLLRDRGRFARSETFVERVVAATASASAGAACGVQLTPGEVAVLRELPSLLSQHEIAERRALSVNTVKSHLRSIYRKLDVASRREAVEVARRRGLL
jgi:LuxR family transcriptional regulator, maltose regulon positive regulatory protein